MIPYLHVSRALPRPGRWYERFMLAALAAVLLSLGILMSGCAGLGTAVGGVVVAAGVDLPAIQAACTKYEPIVGTAAQQTAGAPPGSIAGKISATAAFGVAFCTQVQAGVVPSTANGNSVSWLSEIAGMIKALAPLAQIVIPLL